MMDVSSPFVEEHDSSSQPASIIHNPLTHSITSPLLPSEYRSNSVSGVRPNKTSLILPGPLGTIGNMGNMGNMVNMGNMSTIGNMGNMGNIDTNPAASNSHKKLPSNSSNEGRNSSSEG